MNTQQEWFDNSDCDFCSNKSEKMNASAARPPQHKKANESSQQVAGTTAALDLVVAGMQARLNLGELEDNYAIDHKPPSNISNGTASTDATAVATVVASNTSFTTPAYSFAADKGLTESVLARHQHELHMLNPGDMGAWLEGAGPECTRLAITAAAAHRKKGGHRGAARSKPSQASQASEASYDFVAPPTTEAGQSLDILAAGALFSEQASNPYMYGSHLDM